MGPEPGKNKARRRRARAGCATGAAKLGCLDVRGLFALRALRNFELHFLAFFQRLEAVHGDCGEVREQIFAAIFWCDKSKTFCVIEPLDCT